MEQKKLLWIVAAAGIFLLIVIGTALVLYSPAKNSGPVIASVQPPVSGPAVQADPDAWVRSPETAPGLSVQNETPDMSDLTIVSGKTTVISGQTTVGSLPQETVTIDITGAAQQQLPPNTQGTTAPPVPQLNRTEPVPALVTQTPAAPPEKPASQAKPAAQPVQETKQAPKPAPKVTVTEYWVQAGSYSDKVRAEQTRTALSKNKIPSEVFTKDVDGSLRYRVRVGPYKTKTEAEYWLDFVKNQGNFPDSYVTEVKVQK